MPKNFSNAISFSFPIKMDRDADQHKCQRNSNRVDSNPNPKFGCRFNRRKMKRREERYQRSTEGLIF